MTPPAASTQVEVIPGKLGVTVALRDLSSMTGPVPCWVYLTDGFRRLGHRELAFVLRRAAHEPLAGAPPDPIHVFDALFVQAERGSRVDSGFVIELRAQTFLENPAIRGFGLSRMFEPFGVPAPADALLAIGLFGDEMELARRLGLMRVMTRLGLATRQYPCPAWCERDRSPQVSAAWFQESILSKMPGLRIPEMTATLEANVVTVRVPTRFAGPLREQVAQVPPGAAFSLQCDIDPRADGCLTWEPGQREPKGIALNAGTGERLSGAFVALVGEQPATSTRLFEDGFATTLTPTDEHALKQALCQGQPFTLPPTEEDPGLVITWDAGPGGLPGAASLPE